MLKYIVFDPDFHDKPEDGLVMEASNPMQAIHRYVSEAYAVEADGMNGICIKPDGSRIGFSSSIEIEYGEL